MTEAASSRWTAPVDLDNCETEPIHVPGSVQPHGVLIALAEPLLEIVVVSANTEEWFGVRPADSIGATLDVLLGGEASDAVDAARRLDWEHRLDEVELLVSGVAYMATLYRSGSYLVVEMERPPFGVAATGRTVREATVALQSSRTVNEVTAAAARWIQALTGFDRTMVYRFDEDWHGEVIAERKRDDLNPFLGLHYPSTDIPAQARELYRHNWIRLIPDVAYEPVPLVPTVGHDARRPLDLSTSMIRSVSPIHVEYLSNMGVTASMSLSIIIAGELWGLVACHHYSGPLRVDAAARNAAEYLAQLVSLRISDAERADVDARAIELNAIADHVAEAFAVVDQWSLEGLLVEEGRSVLDLAGAHGALIRAEMLTCGIGVVPSPDVVDAIIDRWPSGTEPFQSHDLAAALGRPSAEGLPGGLIALALTDDRRETLMWFRDDVVRTVEWGGDPHNAKIAAGEGEQVRLSPRKSFERWRETVLGQALPWHPSEIGAAQRFAHHLGAALLRHERDSAMLARDLQRIMRPADLPSIPGFSLSVYCEPAGSDTIGGDWYDVFAIDDHRFALIIGDVAGHGLTAAAEMAQVRNVLRGFLFEHAEPATALERTDSYMMRALPGSIATAVCGIVDHHARTLTVAHAGHVPALLINPSGPTFVEVQGDPLLGVHLVSRASSVHDLSPGSAVVLTSDGLIETRSIGIDEGLDRLAAAAVQVVSTPAATATSAARIVGEVLTDDHDDDITVLVLCDITASHADSPRD